MQINTCKTNRKRIQIKNKTVVLKIVVHDHHEVSVFEELTIRYNT